MRGLSILYLVPSLLHCHLGLISLPPRNGPVSDRNVPGGRGRSLQSRPALGFTFLRVLVGPPPYQGASDGVRLRQPGVQPAVCVCGGLPQLYGWLHPLGLKVLCGIWSRLGYNQFVFVCVCVWVCVWCVCMCECVRAVCMCVWVGVHVWVCACMCGCVRACVGV